MTEAAPTVQMIPINQINFLNPRSRNPLIFQSIVSNIANLGLKKPITVAPRKEPSDGKLFDLTCGQGRLEAFVALGQTEIPAIVEKASKEECLLMSLVENIARCHPSSVELFREITSLNSRGYAVAEIAKKIDVAPSYVGGIIYLLKHGEKRLLGAVENGHIPLTVAMQIARADEAGLQKLLCEGYTDKSLRGHKLLQLRRIIELRKARGKRFMQGAHRKSATVQSAEALVHGYRQEADRQKLLVRRSQLVQNHLLFVATALKRVFADENFLTLLRAEGLDTLPAYLAERIQISEKGVKNGQTGVDGFQPEWDSSANHEHPAAKVG
jgi:ParB family transcriptional regulator, chromosome partitioning protein